MGMITAKYQNKTSRLWGKDCTGSVMGPGRLQLSNGEATDRGRKFCWSKLHILQRKEYPALRSGVWSLRTENLDIPGSCLCL